MGLSYERIKSSFVQGLESLGIVSLDPGRHKQLGEAVDSLSESIRKFLTEEQPEVVAAAPKADPAASADDVTSWLNDKELPKGWRFWQIPSTGHAPGRAVFAHYDVVTQSPVAGIAHVKLETPDKRLIDIQFKPDAGFAAFDELVEFAIKDYLNPPVAESEAVAPDPTLASETPADAQSQSPSPSSAQSESEPSSAPSEVSEPSDPDPTVSASSTEETTGSENSASESEATHADGQ
jgi:hypothetical protein